MERFLQLKSFKTELRAWVRWGIFAGVISAFLLAAAPALAQTTARLYLQVVDASEAGVVVDLMVDGVTNLYGAEVKLTYDPAVIAVQDMQTAQRGIQLAPGFLLSPERGLVLANQVNPGEGTIVYAVTLLKPAPPVSGSGPLARMILTMLKDQPAAIDFGYARLVSADLQSIPLQTEGLSVGPSPPGNIPFIGYTAGPLAVSAVGGGTMDGESFPWWLVAVVIIILGLLTFGALMIMRGVEMPSDDVEPPVEQILDHLLSKQQEAGSKE